MLQYSLVTLGGQDSIIVLVDGELFSAVDSHPQFDEIRRRAESGDESVAELFDIGKALTAAFGAVTDRVTVEEDSVYLDGEPVRGRIGDSLVSLVTEGGLEGARGLARFLERLTANPSHRSREQLYSFIETHGITIDGEGFLMLHKGVRSDGKGGYESVHSGRATVNGTVVNGRIPAAVGDVISMPRSEVSDDPNVACHAGLHAATRDYASGYGRDGAIVTMRVDPADVVSVPANHNAEKLRVCKYEVVEVNTRDFGASFWRSESVVDDEDEWDDDYDVDDEAEASGWSGGYVGGVADTTPVTNVAPEEDEAQEPDPREYADTSTEAEAEAKPTFGERLSRWLRD